MKANFALLALTASLGEVSAHWGNWKDAPKYTPPRAIDNKCQENQKKGWYWDDLQVGQFEKYNDFDFKGWTCGTDKSKRDLTGRHFGKSISAECGSAKEAAPSFGCGAGSKEKSFSLKKFHVRPEFDCRLEFHYDMPDGSTCKHQADCSKDGTDVYNSQCGGAKNVRFVYPKQPNKPKDKCRIEVPQIDFDCDKPQPPTPPYGGNTETVPSGENTKTIPYGDNTKTVPAGEETTTAPAGGNTETVPYGENTETVPAGEQTTSGSSPAETTSAPVGENTETVPSGENTETVPAGEQTTSGSSPAETTSAPVGENTETVPYGENTKTVPSGEETKTVPAGGQTPSGSSGSETTSAPSGDNTETVPAGENTKTVPAGEETKTVPAGENTSVLTTVYDSTSTVYTTEGKTITSCGPEVTSAPSGDNTETVPAGENTKTVPAGEETKTVPAGENTSVITTVYDSTSTVYTTEVKTITSCGPEVTNCPVTAGTPAVVTETVAVSTTICPVTETITHKAPKPEKTGSDEKPETPKAPEDGYDVPDVVPSCLNTFLDYVADCKDNTDAACYCPSKDFVDNVFECLYAHAENDDTVAQAVSFFQGICAPYVEKNPGIATGADSVTEHITVTGTTIITSAHYTTVVVATTITEPVVASGTTVEGSSTVKTIETEIVVPEVGFTSGPAGTVPSLLRLPLLPPPLPVLRPLLPATRLPALVRLSSLASPLLAPVASPLPPLLAFP
ncbi:hypothetical protein FOXG_03558 [Fusarium oxysporum f. sp. lycopersici 4287]|uniref:CFEM domain-containing protein n=1 Tax=Fusarium oxysporum f. sp. lycopersici (strain 4287 / CBS 123668 / FGSC 9935 / NRRL 34936) TaxID=426428 RepID=A0A0J9UK15_FUSO4|nr:hypothetical protein FOXG_03558 [Fusarium oxysporum f. sp. lycopersici 4287]XP_018237794.1 hypothetical protein FOXG_03558 [Fusarium oxysporum f. sp. lycopersici 4287]KNA99747.1 hypothetical protein FOXG_03558 [Fusarium oxysporum f. sp. lycopersici 4287]KNA99748.1 hypothetical protein FOXG_03558 [Fusarium oxysporum f. sp. lycopersici 4287]